MDTDLLPDGILFSEEPRRDRFPDDSDAGAGIVLLLRPETAFLHLEVREIRIVLRAAIDAGIPVLIAIDEQVASLHERSGIGDIRQIADRQIVLVSQGLHGAGRLLHARLSARPRRDSDGIRSQTGNIALDRVLHAIADGHERDDGRHPDDNAQHGEQRAHFIADDRAPRHEDTFEINIRHDKGPRISLLMCPSERITWRVA